jgi:hypothetical protein
MSTRFCTKLQNPQPVRAKDNSPRIHPWVADCVGNKSRQGRQDVRFIPRVLSPLRGLEDLGAR